MNPLLIVIAVLLIANIGLLFYAAHLLDMMKALQHRLADALPPIKLKEKFNGNSE